LPYKSKHTTYAILSASHKKIHLFLQARSRSRIDEVFIYPGSEPDGYILFNGKLAYAFSKNFSSYFKIDNIRDVQFEEIERYRMAGRSYAMGLHYSF
jgi:outer membrane cobalamin receptor